MTHIYRFLVLLMIALAVTSCDARRADRNLSAGVEYAQKEDLDNAMREVKKAAKLHPNMALLLAILLIACAIFVIRKRIPGYFWSQGNWHEDRGEYEVAEHWFLKALSFEKGVQRITGSGIGVAHNCLSLGVLYHRQKRIQEAISMLSTAIKIFTDGHRIWESAPAHASLGKVYFDSGDMQLAEDALNKALSIYTSLKGPQDSIYIITATLDVISERRKKGGIPHFHR